ncbi:MAG: nucleotidyltransferase family protein [bacterium]
MTMVEQSLQRYKKNREAENAEEIEALVRQLETRCEKLARQGQLDEAVLFGSVLTPENFHGNSDLDIALGGVPSEETWGVVSELARGIGREFDVQFLEDMPERWVENIREEGIQLR